MWAIVARSRNAAASCGSAVTRSTNKFHTGARSVPPIAIVASLEFPIGVGGFAAVANSDCITVTVMSASLFSGGATLPAGIAERDGCFDQSITVLIGGVEVVHG